MKTWCSRNAIAKLTVSKGYSGCREEVIGACKGVADSNPKRRSGTN